LNPSIRRFSDFPCYISLMPNRTSKDANQIAKSIVDAVSEASHEYPAKNSAAVALGRLGGKKGGPARAKALTAKRRAEIAKQAAKARWRKR
jgi:hypothetical protein